MKLEKDEFKQLQKVHQSLLDDLTLEMKQVASRDLELVWMIAEKMKKARDDAEEGMPGVWSSGKFRNDVGRGRST